jgi:hypothetical protein
MENLMLSVSKLLSGNLAPGSNSGLPGLAAAFGDLVKFILGPILSIIGVAAVIYAVVLGFNYAKAQDASEREKVKGRLIGAVVGGVIIVAGAVLAFSLNWAGLFNSFGGAQL